MTIDDPSLSAYGHQLLPLATSFLVGNNREFDVSEIFWDLLFIFCEEELITIEGPSLSAHGYQLLILVTSYLVGDNRNSYVLDIFWHVLFIVGGGELITIENLSWRLPIVAHSNQLLCG